MSPGKSRVTVLGTDGDKCFETTLLILLDFGMQSRLGIVRCQCYFPPWSYNYPEGTIFIYFCFSRRK